MKKCLLYCVKDTLIFINTKGSAMEREFGRSAPDNMSTLCDQFSKYYNSYYGTNKMMNGIF